MFFCGRQPSSLRKTRVFEVDQRIEAKAIVFFAAPGKEEDSILYRKQPNGPEQDSNSRYFPMRISAAHACYGSLFLFTSIIHLFSYMSRCFFVKLRYFIDKSFTFFHLLCTEDKPCQEVDFSTLFDVQTNDFDRFPSAVLVTICCILYIRTRRDNRRKFAPFQTEV